MKTAANIDSVHEPSARSDAAYALIVDTSFVADKAGASSRKWRPAPGELVSLWDMLRAYAHALVALSRCLQEFETYYDDLNNTLSRVALARKLSVDVVVQKLMSGDDLDFFDKNFCDRLKENRSNMWKMLHIFRDNLTELELNVSVSQINDMIEMFSTNQVFDSLSSSFRELRRRIEHELENRRFLFVQPSKERHFDDKAPFGEAVKSKFTEISRDVDDANKCLGLDLPTASVFHLMRVMEYGLRRLAIRLKVPKNRIKKKTWDTILKEMNNGITSLSSLPSLSAAQRKLRDRGAEAAAHLNNVRIAWRNPVMHSERLYDQKEAEDIYDNVKTFMNFLATKVF